MNDWIEPARMRRNKPLSERRSATLRRGIRRRSAASSIEHPDVEDTYMQDTELYNPDNTPSAGVIFGVYGTDEWITSSHHRATIEAGKSSLTLEGTWVVTAGFRLSDWCEARFTRFNFLSMNRLMAFPEWGVVEASTSRGKLECELHGEPVEVRAFVKAMDAEFKRAENLIEWVYNARGDSISVPLNFRPAIQGAYPWLPQDIDAYIDGYLDSHASVLILIGPPGTGKTTFIKNLIHRSKGDAKVTYDEAVMQGDSLFANFIESDTKFLIMEDADAFLKSREDGNTMMHRFLNVSDGLISAQDKKLVFSTNLPSVRDIDSALMRPGRCFDVVEFRALTREEAQVVATAQNLELPDGNSFTLAELFNVQPSEEPAVDGKKKARKIRRQIGFA